MVDSTPPEDPRGEPDPGPESADGDADGDGPAGTDGTDASPDAPGASGGETAADGVPTGDPEAEGTDATEADRDADGGDERDVDALRERVESEYDFDDFGPADMAQMSAEEWEAAFDADTWITGPELLDRLAADVRTRVANRDVFARVERHRDPERLLAYSDEGYAMVYPDGSIEGQGTVLRDVKPVVALCSMDSYDVPEPPAEDPLPAPADVPEGGGDFGNRVLQVVAGVQVLAGLVLFGGAIAASVGVVGGAGANPAVLVVAGAAFFLVGLVLFAVVANARLADKFRAEEYRERLRTIGLDDGERPDFVPAIEDEGGE